MAEDFNSRPGGVLFAKDPKKKTNPNQPDFDGSLTLDPACMATLIEQWKRGEPMKLELAGWKKISQKGTNFLSLSAKLPFVKTGQQAQTRPQPSGGFDVDDEIPF